MGICGVSVSNLANADYFIFSFYGGFVHARTYILTHDTLYFDSTHYAQNNVDTLMRNAVVLSPAKFSMAQVIKYNTPLYLSQNPDSTYGCPNCHDQGGYYISYKDNNVVRSFYLDKDTSALPVALQSFAQWLGQTIDSLK